MGSSRDVADEEGAAAAPSWTTGMWQDDRCRLCLLHCRSQSQVRRCMGPIGYELSRSLERRSHCMQRHGSKAAALCVRTACGMLRQNLL